jgi:hypothetical protein
MKTDLLAVTGAGATWNTAVADAAARLTDAQTQAASANSGPHVRALMAAFVGVCQTIAGTEVQRTTQGLADGQLIAVARSAVSPINSILEFEKDSALITTPHGLGMGPGDGGIVTQFGPAGSKAANTPGTDGPYASELT